MLRGEVSAILATVSSSMIVVLLAADDEPGVKRVRGYPRCDTHDSSGLIVISNKRGDGGDTHEAGAFQAEGEKPVRFSARGKFQRIRIR